MKFFAILLVATLSVIPAAARAATILWVDLSTTNQITITAGTGVSSATVSGSDFTGVYLDQFFQGPRAVIQQSLVSGDLTSAENPSDNSPRLWRGGGWRDPGLNIYSTSSDSTLSFTAGQQAFTGSATWQLSAGAYQSMLNGPTSGTIFFAADTFDDLAGAVNIGEWGIGTPPPIPVPLPSTALLFGTTLVGFGLYRRRKQKC